MNTKWTRAALPTLLIAFAACSAASLVTDANDAKAHFSKRAGQLAACYQKDGTLPSSFDETSECWTLQPDNGPGFSATLTEYEPQGSDPYAGVYRGSVQFRNGNASCTFGLYFNYSGEDITGTTSDFECPSP